MMRMPLLVVAVLSCAAAVSANRPQGSLTASLTALAPIVAAGSAGPAVSFPPGPLTAANVIGPVGTTNAQFTCALSATGAECLLTATSSAITLGGLGSWASTSADLLLQVTSPIPTTVATLELQVVHSGDAPWYQGFQIDVGNDGSVELDTSTPVNWHTVKRRFLTAHFSTGALLVRVRNNNITSPSPQTYELRVLVQEWTAAASPAGPACPVVASSWIGWTASVMSTNHHLAPRAAVGPGFVDLHAAGLGSLHVFAISGLPAVAPLQLPPPYATTCDVLANVFAVASGVVVGPGWTGANPQTTDWRLVVPALPPGLVFFVQHLSATQGWPHAFGASNRVRIDT
jgi:hypothetical protein